MPRMKVLNSLEQEAFETPPVFNSVERKRCFDFPTAIEHIAAGLRTPTNQLGFLLSCGYFRATKRFYAARSYHARDLAYLAERAAIPAEAVVLADYDKQTLVRHQQLILEVYGFRPFKRHGRAVLLTDLARLVKSHLRPKLIFFRALELLVREKVEVPGYFPLATLILRAINRHNRALIATVQHLLTPDTQGLLDALLQQQAIDAGRHPGKTNAYRLTVMKKLSQSTKPSTVKVRVVDLKRVEAIYVALKPVLDALGLGPEGIQYYAQSVLKAEIFQLTRRDEKSRSLHLLAFIAH